MLFTNDYSVKMPLGETVAVSLTGIAVVVFILSVIAGMIILVSKAIRKVEKKTAAEKKETNRKAETDFQKYGSEGEIELIDTDEKTAAVIMAIVSSKTGVPLHRLSFRSIRHLGDSEKGGRKTE